MNETQPTPNHEDNTPVEQETKKADFSSFGFKPNIMKGIQEAGYREPSPIQSEAIPVVLDGHDVIGQAQTGTGKTAAYSLPTMNNLKMDGSSEILVITPTRELAHQVSEEMFKLGRFAGVRTLAVYGGQSIGRQVAIYEKGVQIVIATPGRLLDHLRSDRFKGFSPNTVILDESDEMLDMGFLDDIEDIFTFLPPERQTLLFSATMPPQIRELANRILNNPVSIKVTNEETTNADIAQRYYLIDEHERESAIVRLLDHEVPEKSIVFTRTKKEADELGSKLGKSGYQARALHGDMAQFERQNVIKEFKAGGVEILVATDVAARGLDISGVSHVFNYHIPLDPESYVHRIGRTGRAGNKGIAITLVTPLEFKELRRIKEIAGTEIELYPVPTLEDALEQKESRLINEFLTQEISDEAIKFYEILKDEIDTAQLALKLLTQVITKQAVRGPRTIGLQGRALERFEQRLKSPARHSGSGGGGNYRNRNRRRSNSNSGSRSNNYNGRSGGGNNRSNNRY